MTKHCRWERWPSALIIAPGSPLHVNRHPKRAKLLRASRQASGADTRSKHHQPADKESKNGQTFPGTRMPVSNRSGRSSRMLLGTNKLAHGTAGAVVPSRADRPVGMIIPDTIYPPTHHCICPRLEPEHYPLERSKTRNSIPGLEPFPSTSCPPVCS